MKAKLMRVVQVRALMRRLWRPVLAAGVAALIASACNSPTRPSSDIPSTQNPISREQIIATIERLKVAGNNAVGVWDSLPPDLQQAVQDALQVTELTETIEPIVDVDKDSTNLTAEGDGTCKSQRIVVEGKSLFWSQWNYIQIIDWCYNAGKITRKERFRLAEVNAPFWTFTGHLDSTESGGIGSATYRARTQGGFSYCVPWLGCTISRNPWIDQTVNSNGGGLAESGG